MRQASTDFLSLRPFICAVVLCTTLGGCRNDVAIRDQASRTVSSGQVADAAYQAISGNFSSSCEQVQHIKREFLAFALKPPAFPSPLCNIQAKDDEVIGHLYGLSHAYIAVIQGLIEAKPVDYHVDGFFKAAGSTNIADSATLDAATVITNKIADLATSHARMAVLVEGVRTITPQMSVVLDALRHDFSPACRLGSATYCSVLTANRQNVGESYEALICQTFATAIQACNTMDILMAQTGYDPNDANADHLRVATNRLLSLLQKRKASTTRGDRDVAALRDLRLLASQAGGHANGRLSNAERSRLLHDTDLLTHGGISQGPDLTFADFGAARSIFNEWYSTDRDLRNEIAAGDAYYAALGQLEVSEIHLFEIVTGSAAT